ncbi:hypothetical protein [Shewanella surugensis]|uniref:Uncharacterized protein n=1 Tax=Shewanella surugensis TaxID=212020 RepID=A0ABT0L6M3_9GAMM|nr:hypothetical protein [Shewanella surugensis]MCL1123337.1 hypothetical protein [Shewanella surugensis]
MNDFLYGIDWVVRGLEAVTVLLILYLSYQRVKVLFWGGKADINTPSDALLHSSFLCAFTVLFFHFISWGISRYILALDMEVMARRQLFFFMMFMIEFLFIISLFTLHKIRRCSFSKVAIYCLMLGLALELLIVIELVLYGVFDISGFNLVYQSLVPVINIITLSLIIAYPVRHIRNKRMKAYG